ncbi:hypothetical protein Neosp_006764 [[Neocosmospora] mangrovei]
MSARVNVLSRHLKGHGDNDKGHKNASNPARVRLQERQHDPESPAGNTVVVWPLGSASSPSRSSRHSSQPPGVDETPAGTNSATNNTVVSSTDALDPGIVIPNVQEIPVAPNPEPSAPADPDLSFSYAMPPISEDSIANHEFSSSIAHNQAEHDVLMSNSVDSAAHLSFPDETQPATTFRRDSLHGHDTSTISDQDLGHLLGQYADRTWPSVESDWLPGLETELTMPNLDWHSWGNNPLLNFDVTAPSNYPTKRRRKTASFTSEIPDERFAEMAQLWPKRGDQPWQLMQTLWSDSISYKGSNLFSDTVNFDDSYVGAGLKPAEGRLDDQRRMSMSQEYGVECPSAVILAQKGWVIC